MISVGKNIDKAMARTQARTPTERFVLTIYARHAGKDDLQAWPGQDLIARTVGITDRQVRKVVSKLVDRGELHLVRRGIKGKATNVYRVAILDDNFDVIEGLPIRNHSSGSHEVQTGTPRLVPKTGNPDLQGQRSRNSSSCRRDMEEVPSLPASEPNGEVRDIAEKREGLNPTVSPSNDTDLASGAVDGLLGDSAREELDRLDHDEEFQRWIEEVHDRYEMDAE